MRCAAPRREQLAYDMTAAALFVYIDKTILYSTISSTVDEIVLYIYYSVYSIYLLVYVLGQVR